MCFVFQKKSLFLLFPFNIFVPTIKNIQYSCFQDLGFHEWRLDNLILEAITNLKEPRGSSRAAITIYIEVLLFLYLHIMFQTFIIYSQRNEHIPCLQCLYKRDILFFFLSLTPSFWNLSFFLVWFHIKRRNVLKKFHSQK